MWLIRFWGISCTIGMIKTKWWIIKFYNVQIDVFDIFFFFFNFFFNIFKRYDKSFLSLCFCNYFMSSKLEWEGSELVGTYLLQKISSFKFSVMAIFQLDTSCTILLHINIKSLWPCQHLHTFLGDNKGFVSNLVVYLVNAT